MKKRGKVKKYNKKKNFGFIIYDEEKKEIFFQIKNVIGNDKAKIKEGTIVEFIEGKGINNRIVAEKVEILKHFLPTDTYRIIDYNEIDNFNLKLNKCAYFDGEKFTLKNAFDNNKVDFNCIQKRQEKIIQDMGLDAKEIKIKTDWRLALGLGHSSVYETAITLHHIYGIPYIPGQSIKGIVRNFIINNIFYKNLDEYKEPEKYLAEKVYLENYGFKTIFGNKENQGKVIFFDVFPIIKPTLELDIMNPHYRDYYIDKEKKIPPGDYQSPVPINFLTITNTSFRIIIGIKEIENNYIRIGDVQGRTLDVALKWLKRTIEQHGIGAKTSAGYGFVDILDN